MASAIKTLRQQHEENRVRRAGLSNMPRHRRTVDELKRLGPDAVPALLEILAAPREPTDTPRGEVDDGIVNDVAEVLGAIGDPRAVVPLQLASRQYVPAADAALAAFPEGVAALRAALNDPDEFVRWKSVEGLGAVKTDKDAVVADLKRTLTDPSAEVRESSTHAARVLGVPDPALVEQLRRIAREDPSERVRRKADNAVGALRTR